MYENIFMGSWKTKNMAGETPLRTEENIRKIAFQWQLPQADGNPGYIWGYAYRPRPQSTIQGKDIGEKRKEWKKESLKYQILQE